MLLMWLTLLYEIFFVLLPVLSQLPMFHQDDYDVKFEHYEMVWYNKTYWRNLYLDFPWYNRSVRVFNASGYLRTDLISRDIVLESQFYKFMSNEYRYFPISVACNVCDEYDKNRFHVQDVLKKLRNNLHGCPLKKGFYYAYNVPLNYSECPPYIPRGRYKVVVKAYYQKEFVGEVHGYAEVADKPPKWLKQ